MLQFWEALWSNPHTPHLHLFACVAVLEQHRRVIMETCDDLDSLLRYCVQLSGRMSWSQTLKDASALFQWAGPPGLDCLKDLDTTQQC